MAETEKKKKKAPAKKSEAKPEKAPVDESEKKDQPKKSKNVKKQVKSHREKRADRERTRKEKEKKSLAHDKFLLRKIHTGIQKEKSKKKKLLEKLKAAGQLRGIQAEEDPKKRRKILAKKRKKSIKRRKRSRRERIYVEIGRVVCILHGGSRNTLAVIVDVMDNHWVMVDGKCFQQDELGKPLKRRMVNLNDVMLTRFKVKIPYRLRTRKIDKIVRKAQILKKWKRTGTYRTIQRRREKRWSTDLERWRVQFNRRQRSTLIKAEYLKLKRKVMELAKAAMTGKRGLTGRILRKNTLPAEQQALRRVHLGLFQAKKRQEEAESPLKLFTKSKKKKSKKEDKQAAKPEPAAKPSGKKAAKAKPKPKAAGAAAKAKPAAKEGAKGAKPAAAAKQPAKKAAAKPKAEAKAASKPAAKAAPKAAPKSGKPSAK